MQGKIKGQSHAKQASTCQMMFSFLFNLTLAIRAPTKWIFFLPFYLKALSPNWCLVVTKTTRDTFCFHPCKLPSFEGFNVIALEGNSFMQLPLFKMIPGHFGGILITKPTKLFEERQMKPFVPFIKILSIMGGRALFTPASAAFYVCPTFCRVYLHSSVSLKCV